MRTALLVGLVLAAAPAAHATEEPARALSFSAGLGVAVAENQNGQDVHGSGTGGWAEVEYIFRVAHWFTPRLYGGVLVAMPASDCQALPCDVSAQIGFAGAKLRLMAPIPWVGPFVEAGIGGSAGHMATRSGFAVDVTHDGLMYHVPLALGVALGRNHEFEVVLESLIHPQQKQVCGALAAGLTIDL